jgi:hypothetical protein
MILLNIKNIIFCIIDIYYKFFLIRSYYTLVYKLYIYWLEYIDLIYLYRIPHLNLQDLEKVCFP